MANKHVYRNVKDGNVVLGVYDSHAHHSIPADPRNRHYRAFLAKQADGDSIVLDVGEDIPDGVVDVPKGQKNKKG